MMTSTQPAEPAAHHRARRLDLPELTDRQREILAFIVGHHNDFEVMPSIREIADAIGVNSMNAVAEHLGELEKKGYLRRTRFGRARSLRVFFDAHGKPFHPRHVLAGLLEQAQADILALQRQGLGGDDALEVQLLSLLGPALAIDQAQGAAPRNLLRELIDYALDLQCEVAALNDEVERLKLQLDLTCGALISLPLRAVEVEQASVAVFEGGEEVDDG